MNENQIDLAWSSQYVDFWVLLIRLKSLKSHRQWRIGGAPSGSSNEQCARVQRRAKCKKHRAKSRWVDGLSDKNFLSSQMHLQSQSCQIPTGYRVGCLKGIIEIAFLYVKTQKFRVKNLEKFKVYNFKTTCKRFPLVTLNRAKAKKMHPMHCIWHWIRLLESF